LVAARPVPQASGIIKWLAKMLDLLFGGSRIYRAEPVSPEPYDELRTGWLRAGRSSVRAEGFDLAGRAYLVFWRPRFCKMSQPFLAVSSMLLNEFLRVHSQVLDDLRLYAGIEIELAAVDIFVPDELLRRHACISHVMREAEHPDESLGVIYPVNDLSVQFDAAIFLAARVGKMESESWNFVFHIALPGYQPITII
jgi:hypothetical protein